MFQVYKKIYFYIMFSKHMLYQAHKLIINNYLIKLSQNLLTSGFKI
jgi:hypothetical protein